MATLDMHPHAHRLGATLGAARMNKLLMLTNSARTSGGEQGDSPNGKRLPHSARQTSLALEWQA
jgi:hypothetical protein